MITYLNRGLSPFRIEVRLDGKRAGDIRREKAGYYYRTKNGNEGLRMPTIEAVKRSIEG